MIASPAPASTGNTFDVTAYGAVGDGVADDTPAIQRAITAAAKCAGGGTVYFPARTYLLNSHYPSSHPWFFYNLIVGSNVTLSGQTGAKLLQGPHGRHPILAGATEVRNTVLACGLDYATIRFQKTSYNGGFHELKPSHAGASTVTLAKTSDTSHFAEGDYVAIYAQATGDVIPTETSRVASVNASTGVLSLKTPLARSFSTPLIARVTSLATTNVGVKNLIVQGTEPLAVTEAFGFTAEKNQFLIDCSVGGGNVTGLNLNTLNGFRFSGNTISCVGSSFCIMELPQRNSQNGCLEGNTFEVRQMGMGEYAAHWKFTKNRFTLHPDAKTAVGLFIGGFDIDFSNNHVEGGNLTGGGGFGCLTADYSAPDDYAPFVGKIKIADNTVSCQADGNACLGLFAPDTVVTGNTLTVKGSAVGIHAEGPLPQSLTIENNTLSMGSGNGMVIATPVRDGSTISGNTLSGSAGAVGILVASPRSPNSGTHMISNNAIRGFGADVAIDPRKLRSTWPQAYAVERNEASGILTLRTPYYTVEQNLKKGGAVTRIALTHGKAANLLVAPIETRVRDASGGVLSDLNDSAPIVAHRREGLSEIVTVDSALKGQNGRASGLRVKSTLQYRWGYVKVRKEFSGPVGVRLREVCPLATVLAPSLCDYGYREGITEEEKAPAFSFGSNVWGKLRAGHASDLALQTRYVPRSMIFADSGVEGLEWFVGSDLSQWDLQLSGRRGEGRCRLQPSQAPPGLALAVSPFWSADATRPLPTPCVFDFYLAVPLLEGRAHKPWLHASFNRNRGEWVSTEEIRRWAEKGIQTVHCHNDGDCYDDGLFWRDGSYPPYPDMDRYDKVLTDCRRAGIRTATYFSNKELHPSTKEFQEHGQEWGRTNRRGDLIHNFSRPGSEYGAQICLRSGWLDYLKFSIDRVLKHHPLDGVYYDWNVALLCCNPLHEAGRDRVAPAKGHWDIDELLPLMEWTRKRVGPDGLVIIHNTTTPMFATENFADYVVATEWGYRKWTDQAPDLQDLPLEWSLAGARSRGVISYGVLDAKAPRRLHRLFAIEAMLGGVAPWPASEEAIDLLRLLKPLGDIESYRFADWRSGAVTLSHDRCAAAVYSRPAEAYLLLANLDQVPREVACVLHPQKLPHPLAHPVAASRLTAAAGPAAERGLNVRQLIGEGIKITIPGDDAILIHVR